MRCTMGGPGEAPGEGEAGVSDSNEYQSRYAAYCRAHGYPSPGKMLERDAEEYPGGKMCGYILWISERRRAWRGETGYSGECLTQEHQDSFDTWLQRTTP